MHNKLSMPSVLEEVKTEIEEIKPSKSKIDYNAIEIHSHSESLNECQKN